MNNKIFKLKSKYINRDAQLKMGRYSDNTLAIQIIAPLIEGIEQSEFIATISVNQPTSTSLPDNQFYAKGYSENLGILESIVDAGLIKYISEGIQSGYVTLPVYELITK